MEKPRIMLLYAKKTKKVIIHYNFAEFSRTPYDSRVMIMVLKCSSSVRIFLCIFFFKNYFWKKIIADQKHVGPLSPPPFGVAGLSVKFPLTLWKFENLNKNWSWGMTSLPGTYGDQNDKFL